MKMIKDNLINDIKEYCKLNNISDIDEFINNMLLEAFNVKKYGLTPFNKLNEPKEVIKEVIKEIIIEKEVPIEKIITVSDDSKINELINENNNLKQTIELLKTDYFNLKNKYDTNIKTDFYGE